MAVRGLLRLLGPVQPGPGAALESVAAAPASPSEWHRLIWGSPPAAVPCRLFCCPWCFGQGPRCLSPDTGGSMSVSPPKPHSRLLCPSPVIPHRADPSYATGLQPPSPEKPSVAVALLAVFAFFPIVTEPRARRPSVQTIAIVPLPILAPFHQCFCQLAMSGQSTPVVNPPSVLASLK